MIHKKNFGIAVLLTPLFFTVHASDNQILKKDISPKVIKQIDKKIIAKNKNQADAFVELGEPWVEWSQEQKDIKKDIKTHSYPIQANTIKSFKKHAPKNGITIKKENIRIVNP